jgi:hypothetical protein
LQSLAVLCAITMSRDEAEMRLAAFLPLLMDRFPDGAFTQASLEHCATRCAKGFPTYAELAGYLSEWWKANRPTPPALPPPPIRQRPPPTPEEIAHVEQVTRETIAALRSSAQPVVEYRHPGPRHATPEQLDRLNPLPGGRKRHAISTTAAASRLAGQEGSDTTTSANDDDHPPEAA